MKEHVSYESLARSESNNPIFECLGRNLDMIKATAPEGTHMTVWIDICTNIFGAQSVNEFLAFIGENQQDK